MTNKDLFDLKKSSKGDFKDRWSYVMDYVTKP